MLTCSLSCTFILDLTRSSCTVACFPHRGNLQLESSTASTPSRLGSLVSASTSFDPRTLLRRRPSLGSITPSPASFHIGLNGGPSWENVSGNGIAPAGKFIAAPTAVAACMGVIGTTSGSNVGEGWLAFSNSYGYQGKKRKKYTFD